jgi:hypothetical protein
MEVARSRGGSKPARHALDREPKRWARRVFRPTDQGGTGPFAYVDAHGRLRDGPPSRRGADDIVGASCRFEHEDDLSAQNTVHFKSSQTYGAPLTS